MSWDRAHGHLNITHDFGPHERLPWIKICTEAATVAPWNAVHGCLPGSGRLPGTLQYPQKPVKIGSLTATMYIYIHTYIQCTTFTMYNYLRLGGGFQCKLPSFLWGCIFLSQQGTILSFVSSPIFTITLRFLHHGALDHHTLFLTIVQNCKKRAKSFMTVTYMQQVSVIIAAWRQCHSALTSIHQGKLKEETPPPWSPSTYYYHTTGSN